MTDAGSDGGDGENAKEEEEKSFYLLSDWPLTVIMKINILRKVLEMMKTKMAIVMITIRMLIMMRALSELIEEAFTSGGWVGIRYKGFCPNDSTIKVNF